MIDVVIPAWCLKNENVHCVLLGASSVDQLYENMQALQVNTPLSHPLVRDEWQGKWNLSLPCHNINQPIDLNLRPRLSLFTAHGVAGMSGSLKDGGQRS